ncbi:Serine/threonine-protein phosphatase 6 regulatory ankyrin repeat subunit A [Stylophora pistillata]|uniref:Serine/threonine-protein phosphatase 6 regulatory ankyrin repeat subunit A n=1 Tax=Stylophora pistillata TaxID=50429 RepID=A0A2B4RLP3_STYPI|nr:Serine/threonine-protein phosphatase 6 regulatory ankyrin repeat subunit A [Stylophora pistillata]
MTRTGMVLQPSITLPALFSYNSYEAVKALIEYGADPSMKDSDGATPLHFAARHGCVDSSKVLLAFLEFGNPLLYIDAPDFEGNTALHLARQKGHRQTAELLMSQGADVLDGLETNGKLSGHSPLHLAAACGHIDIVKLLISHGASVDGRDGWQRTPLQRREKAAEFDRVDTINFLLENGADVDAKDNENCTAFVLAVKRSRTRTAEQLLDSGADFKSRDASLRKTTVLLLHLGANPSIRDSNRWTALHHCASGGCPRTTQALLSYQSVGAIDADDQNSDTALHVAANYGHVNVLELMLSRGADITARNNPRTGRSMGVKAGVDIQANGEGVGQALKFSYLYKRMAQNPPLFYSIMVILLLINGHTQGRPAAPQLPFGSLSPTAQPQGCDIYGDRVYLPGEVISGDPNGCFAVICTEHGIQIWDGDCQSSTANPKPPSSAPATFEVELTTERPPPTFPEFPFAGVQG